MDYTVAFLLNTLFVRMPETPDTIASTKHRLKPIALNYINNLLLYVRSQGQYPETSEEIVVEISKQNYACEYSVIMVIFDNVIGIVFTQLEQSSLTNFEELIIIIDFDIILRDAIRLRVEEHKAYEYDPKETESVCHEIWKECKSSHL